MVIVYSVFIYSFLTNNIYNKDFQLLFINHLYCFMGSETIVGESAAD